MVRACTLALRTATAALGSRDEGADVAQDVAYDALRGLPRLEHPERFDAWAHRIAIRHTSRALKRRRSRRQREAPLLDPDHAGPSGAPALHDRAEHLGLADSARRALDALPERQRLAVILRYVHDLTDVQIGAALGCRPGTAASLLSRARHRLRESPHLTPYARIEGAPR